MCEKNIQENLKDEFFDISNIDYERVKESEYFQRDELLLDLLETPYFKSLGEKTQVTQRFIAEKDVSTRLTHTYQVVELSSMISDIRGADSTRATRIAAFHDTGHTSFGHIGERTIKGIIENVLDRPTVIGHFIGYDQRRKVQKYCDFSHEMISGVIFNRVLQNSTIEIDEVEHEIIKEGILEHGGRFFKSQSEEGKIVSLADKLAYLTQDLVDAQRIGFKLEHPKELGNDSQEILNTVIGDVKLNAKNEKILSDKVLEGLNNLKEFMYKNFYASEDLEIIDNKLQNILQWAFFSWYSDIADLKEDLYDFGMDVEQSSYIKVFGKKSLNDLKTLFNFENSLLEFVTFSDEQIFNRSEINEKDFLKKSLKNYAKFGIIKDYSL